jgi:ParB family chromosome partitioning protein
LDRDLSVRAAEAIVEAKTDSKFTRKKSNAKKKNAIVQKLEDEIISILGTKVRLNHKGKNGGSIVVDYFSNDDLERILDLLRSVE